MIPPPSIQNNPCFSAALAYLARRWSAIPLCPPDHAGVALHHTCICRSPGKAPLIPWREFMRRLPAEEELCRWWRQYPNGNVGIVLGAISRMVGIDIDGPEGEELLLQVSLGALPPTLEFTTPRGGRRLLYALPPGTIAKSHSLKKGCGELRFLAEGNVTVMPPSRHCNQGMYAWRNN